MTEIMIVSKNGEVRFLEIDDDDYELISQVKWFYNSRHNRFEGKINGKWVTPYHLIMGKPPKGYVIDHIDKRPENCQRSNLRLATYSQNAMNTTKCRGSSKYKGCYWSKKEQAWGVEIKAEGRKIFGGYFNNEVHAAITYNRLASKYFGEFANLNNVDMSIEPVKRGDEDK